uniref:Uncharacterized protein n=1 Tax=Pleurocladia lacustris TaxID=246121 RepID=A0A1I9LW53_9PHAE|nr:hypothetical protein [Pleurocladia lacustris]ANS57823.1 hypothetical protein [Pleurocladia lacustris]
MIKKIYIYICEIFVSSYNKSGLKIWSSLLSLSGDHIFFTVNKVGKLITKLTNEFALLLSVYLSMEEEEARELAGVLLYYAFAFFFCIIAQHCEAFVDAAEEAKELDAAIKEAVAKLGLAVPNEVPETLPDSGENSQEKSGKRETVLKIVIVVGYVAFMAIIAIYATPSEI